MMVNNAICQCSLYQKEGENTKKTYKTVFMEIQLCRKSFSRHHAAIFNISVL